MGLNERNNIQVPLYNNIECRPGRVNSDCLGSTDLSQDVRTREIPPIVPCYNGRSLKIHEELVGNGLSAISIRHHNGNCKDEKHAGEDISRKKSSKEDLKENKENGTQPKKLTDVCYLNAPKSNDVPDCLKDRMQRRNSFWNVHRPELAKLTWPENFVSSVVLQDFFHDHLRIHGTFCEPLHDFTNRSSIMDEEFRDFSKLRCVSVISFKGGEHDRELVIKMYREIVPPRILPPDERVINIMEKSRSVQLNDEDLDPETMVHKSRAEFCVTIGEYVRRPPLKRTTSQQLPKNAVQQTNRFESLPLQHEGLLSKEGMVSEERVSAIIGSTDFYLNSSVSKKSSKKLNSGNISGILVRRGSVSDPQREVATSPPSLNNFHSQCNEQVTEDSGDPARLRTILSPRDESAEESGSRQYRV